MDTGFDTRAVTVARFELDSEGFSDERMRAFNADLLERAAALPGVAAAALAETVPLGTGWSRRSVSVDGYTPDAGEDMEVLNNRVTTGFFAVMGIEVESGREFTAADRDGATPVVIVSRAFARRFWPGESPLGKLVHLSEEGPPAEVVGLVPDAKYRSLVEDPEPYLYHPYEQNPSPYMALVVRSAADPQAVSDALRNLARSLAPTMPPPSIRTFQQHMATATLPQRIAGTLLTALGFCAVVIAAIGLYGLVAFGVGQRAREFGIRMALGAGARDIRRLVLRGALGLVFFGVACGVPFAVAVTLLMRSFLVVAPIDPVAFVGVPLLLASSALLASYQPARRATRLNPSEALRAE
jgi:predicted permease